MVMFRIYWMAVFTVFFLGVTLVSTSQAQKLIKQFDIEMPVYEELPQAEFEEQTDLIDDNNQPDLALRFQIRIPKGWIDSNADQNIVMNSAVLGSLRKFYGPATLSGRSTIDISVSSLDYNMTAYQWLIDFLLKNGYNAQGIKKIDDRSVEALYVFIKDDQTYVVRSTVRINGKHAVMASYYMPVEHWNEEHAQQQQIISSFKLKEDIQEYVEKMEVYKILDVAEFQYPVTWKTRAEAIRTIDRMNIDVIRSTTIKNVNGQIKKRLDGQIDIGLISIFATETLEDEIELFTDSLKDKKLVLGDVLESRDDFVLGEIFDFVDTQVYNVINQGEALDEHELWLTIMSAGDYYYFASLFTPSRNSKYFEWARNVETYRLVVKSIEPQVNSFSEDDVRFKELSSQIEETEIDALKNVPATATDNEDAAL